MSTTVSFNGVNYNVPAVGEGNWGTQVSNYLIAIASGALQKTGGSFTLTADVDFGATYGLKSSKFSSRNTPSTAGVVRLGNNESVGWRNAANSADKLLKVNASNVLEFDGNPLLTLALGAANTALVMNGAGTAYSFAKIVDANIDAAAAIAYSKLNLSTSIVNADINAAAAIAYSKLNLSTSIVNADISGSAAIAYSKLALTGSIVNNDLAGSIASSKLVGTDIATVGTITAGTWNASVIAIAYGGTNSSTALNNNRVMQSNAGAIVEAAAITASRALVSDANGIPTHSSVTSTELGYVSGVTSAIQTQISGKASLAGDTFTGNITLDNQKEIRFREATAGGTNYVGFKAAAALSADLIWTLPTGDGSANQVLQTNGSGVLSWATIVAADANNNISADAFISGFTTTATAAGTTTLTVDSKEIQEFTGTTTQTVTMPTTSIVAGQRYTIINNSTGVVTVQASGGGTIQAMPANTTIVLTALTATPTTAAHWDISGGATAVGEIVEATITSTTIGTSNTDVTGASITLTQGTWELVYNLSVYYITGTSSGNNGYIQTWIYNNTDAVTVTNSLKLLEVWTVAAAANTISCNLSVSVPITITGSKTYKVQGKRTDVSGTGSSAVSNSATYTSNFYARRIK